MLEFQKVRWKNLLSTGDQFTEIQLNRSPTNLIVGENGNGKSTVIEAVVFGLFGKPYRNINKNQLVNSINTKYCVVEIELRTQNKDVKIVRGIKPNKFEVYVDGNMINQDASVKDYQKYLEEHILKLNYKSFTQVVILGSATYVPFMQLSAKDRRSVVEDILDINIFSYMNLLLKGKMKQIQEDIDSNNVRIDILDNRIDTQEEYIQDVINNRDKVIREYEQELDEAQSSMESAESTILNLKVKRTELLGKITNHDKVNAKLKKLHSLEHSIKSKLTNENKQVAFYHDNNDCPVCRQSIDDKFREEKIQEGKNKISEIETGLEEMNNHVRQLTNESEEMNNIVKEINKIDRDIHVQESIIEKSKKYIKKFKHRIKITSEESGSEEQEEKLNKFKTEKELITEQKYKLTESQSYYEVVKNLLQDTGIKSKVIKKYLPIMNQYINSYLSSMDFYCNFNIDENFNETIKSRFRDDFTYASFSEGEKCKINIALLFTWRQIARMKNSCNTNLLILDEIFDSSLDNSGTDELMKILNTFGENNNIFIISHKGDLLFDKFRSVIKFEKQNNFSHIA